MFCFYFCTQKKGGFFALLFPFTSGKNYNFFPFFVHKKQKTKSWFVGLLCWYFRSVFSKIYKNFFAIYPKNKKTGFLVFCVSISIQFLAKFTRIFVVIYTKNPKTVCWFFVLVFPFSFQQNVQEFLCIYTKNNKIGSI